MHILINGYLNALPKNDARFSGPRNFLAGMLQYIDASKHTYTCVVLLGKKEKNNLYRTRRIRTTKDSSWIVAKLRLNTQDILLAKKPGIPTSLEQPLHIITKIIAKEKPDLVILQGMSISNWYLLRAAKQLGIPVITNHLGLWYKEIEAYNNSTASGKKILNEMERDMTRYSTKELFLTELSYTHYNRQLIRVPKKQLAFLPLPYDNIFKNTELPALPKNNPLKIGIVARWDPIKQHEVVLRLAKAARKEGRSLSFHAVTTIHKAYPWYKELQKEYPEFITVHPPMTPRQLKDFYKDMNLLILPSRFDVSPTVVMEASLQNRNTIISPGVGWVTLYKKLGMKNLITDFRNTRTTLDLIEAAAKKTPPKLWIKYLIQHHAPKAAYEVYLNLAEEAINNSRAHENRPTRS